MPAHPPDPVKDSVTMYRRLLRLYPKNHRREFGGWMVQVFRDLCRHAYLADGWRGLLKVWLKTFPDLVTSAASEHEYEFRRSLMNAKNHSRNEVNPRWVFGLLISASIIAIGMIASIVIRESGGPALAALIIAVVLNLAGALVMDLFSQRDGAVLAAMGLLMLFGALPLLWVPDQTAWIRENPLTLGAILILVAYMRYRFKTNWPLFAVALILGGAHILISFV